MIPHRSCARIARIPTKGGQCFLAAHLRALESRGHFKQGGLTLRDANDPDSFKVRRAKVGGYSEDFAPEQVAELDELVAKHLSPRFGYGPAGKVGPLASTGR